MQNIDEYGAWTERMWLGSGQATEGLTDRDYAIMSLGLPGEVGEVMELLKKQVRDGHLDRENLKKELGDVAYYWARLCLAHGLRPSEVLACNVEKIESRRARGVLRGSGDNR